MYLLCQFQQPFATDVTEVASCLLVQGVVAVVVAVCAGVVVAVAGSGVVVDVAVAE